ncbi:MAG: zf-HC2 domain-containing protein [Sporichthyaceae bacterium]
MSTAKPPAKPAAQKTPEQAPGDAKLISAARRGDNEAFETLLSRHHDAAMRLSRRLAPNSAAEVYDAAVESVEAGLRAGTGPRVAFRPYLLTAVRRANYDRAKAAGKVRPTDELAANKVLLIASSSIGADLLGQTTLAYRELTEVQQLALWHTEVDGEPFLDTGLLLGLSGTEVAELAFGARDELRRAMVGAQLDSAAAGPCKWTCDRLGAHVRRRLTPTIAEKVRGHLEHCASCRELVPAVTAMEAEMQSLIAMVVLGAAAGPYLDLDSVPAKGRKAAVVASDDDVVVAGFFGHGRRKAVFAGVGAIIAAAGLFGGLSMAQNSASENIASDAPDPKLQLPDMLDDYDAGPEAPEAAGSGSAGSDTPSTGAKHARAYTGETETVTAQAPRSAPKHAKPALAAETGEPKTNGSKKASQSQKPTETPAEKPESAPADSGTQTIALGALGGLELTPNAGLLGVLPSIELLPPAS